MNTFLFTNVEGLEGGGVVTNSESSNNNPVQLMGTNPTSASSSTASIAEDFQQQQQGGGEGGGIHRPSSRQQQHDISTPNSNSSSSLANAAASQSSATSSVTLQQAPVAQKAMDPAARVELKLIVPNSRAGAIIGIQGAIIREIREATGATVKVSDRFGAADRQVAITGTREQVHLANSIVQSKLAEAELEHAENAAANGGAGAGMGGVGGTLSSGLHADLRVGSLSPSPIPPGQMEIRMLVSNAKVGGLIGKGGAAINHIRSASGCQIKIAKEDLNNPTASERAISIIGEQPRIELAQQLILMRLNEVSIPPSPSSAGNNNNNNPMSAVQRQQQQQQQQQAMVYPAYANAFTAAQPWPPVVLAAPPPSMPVEESVSVPEEYVGRVIGKKGATINEIRVQSGCKITVQPPGENPTIRVITLVGNDEARKAAKFLISSKIY